MAAFTEILYVAPFFLLAGAAALFFRSGTADIRSDLERQIRSLFNHAPIAGPRGPDSPRRYRWLLSLLYRAGFEPRPAHIWLFGGCCLLSALVGLESYGIPGGFVFLGTPPIAGAFILTWRSKRRLRLMVHQIPAFLNQVARGLDTGRNLDSAIDSAAQDVPLPLSETLDHATRAMRLGANLDDAFEDVADVYRLPEMRLVALAIRVTHRYGGSAKDLLANVVTVIRQREQAQRELRALTAETRISAVVLAATPASIAVYMMKVNPQYLGGMWAEPTGRKVLIAAVMLQAVGTLLLWRMTRSV